MSIKTIRKAYLLSMIIGFGILPSLSWGGEVYDRSNGYVGRVDPGDTVGALYLLKDKF